VHEIGADPGVRDRSNAWQARDRQPRHFKPHLRAHELPAAVDEFEGSILFYTNAHARARVRGAAGSSTPSLASDTGSSSGHSSTAASSCVSSLVQSAAASTEQLVVISGPCAEPADELATALRVAAANKRPESREESESERELEAAAMDCSVRVLPGVKALLASIPVGRYVVATSGAKTSGALPLPLPPCPCGFCRD
jgi:hypothetical protein